MKIVKLLLIFHLEFDSHSSSWNKRWAILDNKAFENGILKIHIYCIYNISCLFFFVKLDFLFLFLFKSKAEDLATGLIAIGLHKGDRLGLWAPNCIEWILTQYATSLAGIIQVEFLILCFPLWINEIKNRLILKKG